MTRSQNAASNLCQVESALRKSIGASAPWLVAAATHAPAWQNGWWVFPIKFFGRRRVASLARFRSVANRYRPVDRCYIPICSRTGVSYCSERRANAPTSPKIITSSGATHRLTAPRVSHLPPPSPTSATRVSTDTPHPICKVPLLRRPTKAQIRAPVSFAI